MKLARIAVTGAAGFLGTMLTARLLETQDLKIGGERVQLGELLLLDLERPHDELVDDPRVIALTGDVAASVSALGDVDALFHLAGAVSSAAEEDFDLGMHTNVDGLRSVLEGCRAMAMPPLVVFSSSLAVYGADPALGAVGTVDEETLPRPQSSYGTQKFIGEQLIADYTRKGFLRGRSVRLMTVTVRPGRPNAAASSFISGIIREPLAGERSNCPVPPDTALAVSSPARTIDGILRASEVEDDGWGSRTAMNLPALTTTPQAMLDSLERVAGADARRLVDWEVDPSVLSIVGSWPSRVQTPRAAALGLEPEESFDAIVDQYVQATHPPAVS